MKDEKLKMKDEDEEMGRWEDGNLLSLAIDDHSST